MNFSLPDTVTISNIEYRIRTDFRTILEIFVMLDDPDLTDADKTEAPLRVFFIERPSDPEAALQAFTDFVDPHSSQKAERKKQSPLIDWHQHFDLMVAPINHILGFECRAAEYLHWQTFLAAYLEIPPDSIYARVLRIREKLLTGKKLEKYERSWYGQNRGLVHLRTKLSKAEKELLEAWTCKSPLV